jgi:sugar lactone lactonase YvrE
MLMGVAVDHDGQVFVALNNFGAEYGMEEDPQSGVLHVTPDGIDRVMTLPDPVYANGLEVKDGTLFVTDSRGGSIWTGPADSYSEPAAPWFQSQKLEPIGDGLGANGIAFGRGALHVTSSDQGLILKVPVRGGGAAGQAEVLAQNSSLIAADGLTFRGGKLWVAINGQYDEDYNLAELPTLVVVDAKGHPTTAATPADSLDYPTAVVVGRQRTLFVSNGSFMNGSPNVVALSP